MANPTKEQLDALEKRLRNDTSVVTNDLVILHDAADAIASLRAQLVEAKRIEHQTFMDAAIINSENDTLLSELAFALSRERELRKLLKEARGYVNTYRDSDPHGSRAMLARIDAKLAQEPQK